MSRGVFGNVGVVQVGHLFVPVLWACPAQIRSRDESALAMHLQFSLKSKGFIRRGLLRRTPVDEENRYGPSTLRDVIRQILGGNQSLDDVQFQAAGGGHGLRGTALTRKRDVTRLFARAALPYG